MKILFATAHYFLPQLRAGLQRSSDMLARRLIERGYDVSVVCSLMPPRVLPSRVFGTKAGKIVQKFLEVPRVDSHLGYMVYRSYSPWKKMQWVLNEVKPDVIVVLAVQPVRMALAARKIDKNISIVMMLQDVEFHNHGGPFEDLGFVSCVANSHFTSEFYRKFYNVNPIVIYPFIDVSSYKTLTTKDNITFINPDPRKGLDIAIAVASKCPDIPFVFLESWPLSLRQRRDLRKLLGDFPNITLRTPIEDMRQIYSRCKILLVPSRWEEAYGRVATEAQFSGIPVIASNRGGLPEAVGDGGILLDPDGPLENWIAAVRRLWNDNSYYSSISAAATLHAARPALDLEHQTDMWQQVLKHAADSCT